MARPHAEETSQEMYRLEHSEQKRLLGGNDRQVAESTLIKQLLKAALTDKINDRETFMKGIDYSYYYEQED